MDTLLNKTYRLYKFLQELQNVKNPFPLALEQYTWVYMLDSLPIHPEIKFVGYSGTDSDYVLCLGRPVVKPPPAPPGILNGWITSDIADPFQETISHKVRKPENSADALEVAFTDDEHRLRAWQDWLSRWRTWAETERPARQALEVFEKFYGLKGRLDREGDRFEMVLGDGILRWKNRDTTVYHPVLLQKVQLEFDAYRPEFRIVEADSPPEFYGPAIREASENQDVEAQLRAKLESKPYHPLDPETNEFYVYLANFLSSKGQFIGNGLPKASSDGPIIGRAAVLFLRPRSQGFSRAIEGVLKVLPERIDTLKPLQRVVGVESDPAPSHASSQEETAISTLAVQDVLLSKPANREQLLLVKNLIKHSGVVVQGPPGTGKTHTIANLVGHLLAEGKSVLVTAHTSKALRVLRDKVAPELKPLCVSILDSDQDSRRQLEESVVYITQKLGEGPEILEQDARVLAERRNIQLEELAQKRQLLIEALGGEYREVMAAGRGFVPSEAARLVRQYNEQGLDWIPGRILRDTPLPLSLREFEELYESSAMLNLADEAELRSEILDIKSLPEPLTVEEWCRLIHASVEPGSERPELWARQPTLDQLEILSKALGQMLYPLQKAEPWHYSAIAAGRDPQMALSWTELIKQIEAAEKLSGEALELSIRYVPSLPADISPLEQARLAGEIAEHLKSRGKLNMLTLLSRPQWKVFIQKARVSSDRPQTYEHFRALNVEARLRENRQQLVKRWRALIFMAGGIQLDSAAPEKLAVQFIPLLKEGLRWYSDLYHPFQQQLVEAGFDLTAFLRLLPPNPAPNGELLNLKSALEQLETILQAKQVLARQAINEKRVKHVLSVIDPKQNQVSAALAHALETHSFSKYTVAYKEALRLKELMPLWQRRVALLERLRQVAPDWARAIEKREGPHGNSEVPREPETTWLCKLLSQELESRSATSINTLQADIANLEKEFHQATADLVERRAWSSQIRKTSLKQRQALVGWLSTVKKIGKGTGKRAPRLRVEAARLMAECRSAVPVWIMPLARVIEQFKPEHDLFDVIVVDEASQTDLYGLILFAMARKIIVVGDKEQVSPLAVGENIEKVESLLPQLGGIPNAALYDGTRSIYDIASESFGGQVMLREHFRSVPEIIQFSNVLCYGGKINPLRESGHSHLKPAVRAVRVKGFRKDKRNPVEAREIVDIIKRCIEDSQYAAKTIGVISMVGEDQALQIEQMLREEIPPGELQSRRLLCGNPAQFQGDERDVMFLSLVDVSEGAPLPLRDTEPWRQRFNVAASRARDQMWVVHSLDPIVDLKPGDLRRLLIEHALHPGLSLEQIKVEGAKTESPFEREVLEHLTYAGYRVQAQWQVGSYRIDLVVESAGKRVAVECDGDRYHPPEKWPEDLERQRVLERLGWQFIRIRGSNYYRDPTGTVEWLIDELEKRGMKPKAIPESAPPPAVSSTIPTHPEAGFDQKTTRVPGFEENQQPLPDPSNGVVLTIDSSHFAVETEPVLFNNVVTEGQTSLESSKQVGGISPQQNEIDPEDLARIKQVLSTNPEMWFELAHWAKEHGHFEAWERRLIYSLGGYINKGQISHKQAMQAVRLIAKAQKLGFESSKASRKSQDSRR